jgi:transcriptional regulator with XRE-family HTH domain
MRRTRLINARKERGWTQQDVAKQLGITASSYGMFELGTRTPRLPVMRKLERLFGIPWYEMFPDKANIPCDEQAAALEQEGGVA